MQPETRKCQNCQKSFIVEPDDFSFYEKIKVPPPTLCVECRQQRRYAWRNERTLYRRNCDLCGKSTVTIYSPNKPYKVYCLSCWWGDGWDPAKYGRDFDFNRPFFEQFKELMLEVPRMAVLSKNSVKSEYTNHSGDNKNTYMSFCCFDTEDVSYSTYVMESRGSMDCSYIIKHGERLYECIDSNNGFGCQFSVLLENCVNCFYSYDCRNCNDCFLCSNLRNKSFCFKNKQYSKEEYAKKIEECNLGSHAAREKFMEEFSKLYQENSIHKYMVSERSVNSSGNFIFNSKNTIHCFDVNKMYDAKNIFSAVDMKSVMDCYHVGFNTELAYEDHGCTRVYDAFFSHLCYDNSHIQYCDSCQNSQNLFGCISIKKGEYMIFNRKYSKEEYIKLRNQIIEHMKKTGEYGEFFPPPIAPVCYNETQGNYYMPLSKEEVLDRGWLWEDEIPGIFGKETIQPEDLADNIKDVNEDIFSAALKCVSCSKNYNIIPDELAFYKRENIPLPRKCPDCRYRRRFSLRLPRQSWFRQCMCDKGNHGHEGKCSNEFETSYAPERPEIIYCESCYQKEVY